MAVRRTMVAALAATVISTVSIGVGAPGASARPSDPPPSGRGDLNGGVDVVPTSAAPRSGAPGQHSAPEWFPLRHDVSGGPIKTGCTHRSYGSQYGYACGGHHEAWALDLMAGTGTMIYPAGAGFATPYAGRGSGYGIAVVVDHGNGVQTIYAHMSRSFVPPEGMWVGLDDVLGLVGETGDASAPHLHYEKTLTATFGTSGAVDPGPLRACWGTQLVTYPQAGLRSTWDALPWGAIQAASDGTACVPATGTFGSTASATAPRDGVTAATASPLQAVVAQLDLWAANVLPR